MVGLIILGAGLVPFVLVGIIWWCNRNDDVNKRPLW